MPAVNIDISDLAYRIESVLEDQLTDVEVDWDSVEPSDAVEYLGAEDLLSEIVSAEGTETVVDLLMASPSTGESVLLDIVARGIKTMPTDKLLTLVIDRLQADAEEQLDDILRRVQSLERLCAAPGATESASEREQG